MGLLDILNGMQNGPRGQSDSGSGGMSPVTMALLALLAYKAYKNMTGGEAQASPAGQPAPLPSPDGATTAATDGGLGGLLGGLLGGSPNQRGQAGGLGDLLGGSGQAGGLGDLLKGGLGGLLAGGAAGSVLSGGLDDLFKQFQQSGKGDVVDTWVGKGPNKPVSPADLASALGADRLNFMTQQTGLSQQELLTELSQALPGVIDQLTPDGHLPTEQEALRLL